MPQFVAEDCYTVGKPAPSIKIRADLEPKLLRGSWVGLVRLMNFLQICILKDYTL